ncbi:MAG TPA: hypothetical protein VJH70_02095 [Candidatus Paceibacterota bacterium]
MTIEEFSTTASDENISDTQIEKMFLDIERNASKEIRERALSILKERRPSVLEILRAWPNSHY